MNSQNGWPVLAPNSSHLHRWVIPTKSGTETVVLRDGSAGFLLAHNAMRISDWWEPMVGKILDDWGYAERTIRGSSTEISNHASGTAMDFNATRHPLGKVGTWGKKFALIVKNTATYRGTIRWGGEYHGRKDEMHFEINAPMSKCEKRARALMNTYRGKKLLEANPGQKAVILS